MPTQAASFLQTEAPAQDVIAFSVGPSSQRPSGAVPGYVYSDTTLNALFQWSGTSWIQLPIAAPFPFTGGTTANRPVPTFPYLYMDTTLQQLLSWNGSTWVVIGPISQPPPPLIQPPQITSQPASQTVGLAASVTFTVAATGAGSLTYQWSFNGVSIGGATSASYNIPSSGQANGGTYTVTVTGSGGTTTSQGAVLTVTGAPFITQQPSSQTVPAGGTANFSVGATGTAPLTYQWLLNNVVINGATSSTHSASNVQAANAGNYTVTVTNGSGSATSSAANLNVTPVAHSATWSSYSGVAVLTSASNIIFGFQVANANISASTINFQLTPSNGTFPAGVAFSVFAVGGGSALFTKTSAGGETALNAAISVPTTSPNAGYTVVCSYSSALVVTGVVSIVSGSAVFINSSIRATVYGGLVYPPQGFAMEMATNTLATGSIVNASFYQSLSHTYYGPPFAWNFNSNTATNPLNNFTVGSNTVSLTGYAPPGATGDSVLELDSTT